MNKLFKNITAITLVSVMALTGIFAFAAGGAVYAAEDQDSSASLQQGLDVDLSGGDAAEPETAPEPEEIIPQENVVDSGVQADEAITLNTAAVDSNNNIIATAKTYSDTKLPAPTEILNLDAQSNLYTVFQVIAKTTGKMYFNAEANTSNSSYVYIDVGTFNSSTKEFTHNDYFSLSPGQSGSGGGFDVESGKIYVIGIASNTYGQKAKVNPYVLSYKTRKLSAGTKRYMLASGKKGISNSSSSVKFKFKAKKTGCIRVWLKTYGFSSSYGKVTLLNSKKKTVSTKVTFNDYYKNGHVAFGVQKGKTYYLKVTDCTGSYSNQYAYGIKYKYYSYSKKKNTKKKKAITLKRKGKYKKIAVPANGKKGSQWYKFKVTKKRTTQVTVDAKYVKSGKFKITVYCGKKKVGTGTISNGYVNKYKITNSTTYGKANKGTYYVKISKDKKGNGAYKIKYTK